MDVDHLTFAQAWEWSARLWQLLLIVWLLLWFGMKRAKKREAWTERLQHTVLVLLGFWLLFGGLRHWAWLNDQFLASAARVWLVGLVLTAAGIGISIWARLSLGSNWSGTVTLKKDHQLVRQGLYHWIRHPIYTGILLAMLGTAVILGEVRGLVGLALVLIAFYFKARREECFLRQEFGADFEDHASHTGMFLPKLL